MIVTIDNLTDAQFIALEDLLATWRQAGGVGCSRWTSFFADGDGNFRPRITVNGEAPQHQNVVNPAIFWTGGAPWRGEYKIDFDAIAIGMRHRREQPSPTNGGDNGA